MGEDELQMMKRKKKKDFKKSTVDSYQSFLKVVEIFFTLQFWKPSRYHHGKK